MALLAVGGGAYWFVLKPKPVQAPKPGDVVALDPIQINLEGEHYLRIGIALQLTAATKEADGSKALDATIDEFSGLLDRRGQRPEEARGAEEGARAPPRGALRGRGHGGLLHGVRHAISLEYSSGLVHAGRFDRREPPCIHVRASPVIPACAEDATSSKAVAYDFRRPIQLSREHSRILQVGFDGFARQATTLFTSSLRTVCTLSLLSVEQQNYGEYVEGAARADVHDHLHRRAPRRARRARDARQGRDDLHRPHPRRSRLGPAAAAQPQRDREHRDDAAHRAPARRDALLARQRPRLPAAHRRRRVQPPVRPARRRLRRDGGRDLRPAHRRPALQADHLPAVQPSCSPTWSPRPPRRRSPTASAPPAPAPPSSSGPSSTPSRSTSPSASARRASPPTPSASSPSAT